MEEEEKYEVLGIRVKEFEGKKYPHCYILNENKYGFDIIDIKILEKQIEPLKTVIRDDTFDVRKFITVDYNRFKKSYEPKISFGL